MLSVALIAPSNRPKITARETEHSVVSIIAPGAILTKPASIDPITTPRMSKGSEERNIPFIRTEGLILVAYGSEGSMLCFFIVNAKGCSTEQPSMQMKSV